MGRGAGQDEATASRSGTSEPRKGRPLAHALARRWRYRLPVVAVAAALALPRSASPEEAPRGDPPGRPQDSAAVHDTYQRDQFRNWPDAADELDVLVDAEDDAFGVDLVSDDGDDGDGSGSDAPVVRDLAASGIPEVALRAYQRAAGAMEVEDPRCGLRWSLVAAIGRVESNHGRYGGALLREDGYGTKPIRGIPLDGRPGVALIRDTDGGRLDGDGTYDRAVGPMQFIPSTWRSMAADGNSDGRHDPDNIFDAALAAAAYLCAGDADLRQPGQTAQAVLRYNHSYEYMRTVLALAAQYERGGVDPLPTDDLGELPTPPAADDPPRPATAGPPPGLDEPSPPAARDLPERGHPRPVPPPSAGRTPTTTPRTTTSLGRPGPPTTRPVTTSTTAPSTTVPTTPSTAPSTTVPTTTTTVPDECPPDGDGADPGSGTSTTTSTTTTTTVPPTTTIPDDDCCTGDDPAPGGSTTTSTPTTTAPEAPCEDPEAQDEGGDGTGSTGGTGDQQAVIGQQAVGTTADRTRRVRTNRRT